MIANAATPTKAKVAVQAIIDSTKLNRLPPVSIAGSSSSKTMAKIAVMIASSDCRNAIFISELVISGFSDITTLAYLAEADQTVINIEMHHPSRYDNIAAMMLNAIK